MAETYSVRYYGAKYGTMCAIPINNISPNYYIRKFTFYFCDLTLPYDPNGNYGSGVNAGKPPRENIQGMQWFSKPTSGSQKGYASKNTLATIAGANKASYVSGSYPRYDLSWYHKQEFTWEPIEGFTGGTIYIGFWSPVDSSTRFGFAQKFGEESYYNAVESIKLCVDNRGKMRCPVYTFDSRDCVPSISKPSISITDYTSISRYDGSATIKWSDCKDAQSDTYLDINGVRVNHNSGDNKGELTFKPSNYNVAQGSSYTVKVYRHNDYNKTPSNPNGTTVSASVTMYTYTEPKLSDLKISIPKINANQTQDFTWNTNVPKWKNKNLETHTESMTIDKHNVTEVSDSAKSDLSSISLANIGRYVDFDKSTSAEDGQTAKVVLTKVHTNDNQVPSASIDNTTFIVRRRPTEYILKDSTSFIYNLITIDSNDDRNNDALAEDAIVDRETSKYIKVSFTYPSNKPKEHYGIINGYKIVVRSEDGTITFEDDIETTSLINTYNIPVNEIKYSLRNTLEITPYYKHSNKTFNSSIDNNKYYGKTQERRFPSVITRLGKPTINFPTENSTWINKNYRVLFQLPADGDFDNYGKLVASDYIYRDIEIEVKAGTITKIYSWKSNPEIFSLNKLSYQYKVAINPSLMPDYPSAGEYKIRLRVRKNYGYPESYSKESWSDWSLTRTVKVQTISHSVNEGDYILATHQNKVYNFIVRMKTCYKDSRKPVRTVAVKRGDYILANPFDNSYQDIVDVFDMVNGWETNAGDFVKNPVKFNNGNNLTQFVSTRGEYITDKSYDTSPTGRNYMTILHEIANLCK